ncbi:MAG TPA: alpha/beta fold hydrolase [Anaerolineae bacterium]|nr:alpha/beta fold hydrolase [Anaerolineae bacterium]
MLRLPIYFHSGGERLAGEVSLPEGTGPHPALLLIGGTLSDTRDGDTVPSWIDPAPPHKMLRVIAEQLANAGIGSLRWDKRGVGESTGADRALNTDTVTDTDDAEQALNALANVAGVDVARIAVLGESAGAHVACLLAARTDLPAAYVLQGALYDSIPEMMAFNYERLHTFCARGAEEEEWVKQVAPHAYKISAHWRAMVAAAERGDEFYEDGEGETFLRTPLRRLKSDLAYPPAEQFRYIQTPTLVIQGERDLNVPPDNSFHVAQTLRAAGNQNVTHVVVPGADHSMQLTPDDIEQRLRERISFESFKRPYSQFFLYALAGWLRDRLCPPRLE